MKDQTAIQITHDYVVQFSRLIENNERLAVKDLARRIRSYADYRNDSKTAAVVDWLENNPAEAEKTWYGLKTYNTPRFSLWKRQEGGPYVEFNSTTAGSVERIGRRSDGLWWLGWRVEGEWYYQVLALDARLPHRRKEFKGYIRLLIEELRRADVKHLNYETESL